MGFRFIGFLALCFVGMTMLNRILEGLFITESDVSVVRTLTFTHDFTIGWFAIPVLNADFFFVGLPRLVKWDYSFFGGNAGILQYFLYSMTAALSFLLFTLIVGLAFQYFRR
jgi:hypothetical protein